MTSNADAAASREMQTRRLLELPVVASPHDDAIATDRAEKASPAEFFAPRKPGEEPKRSDETIRSIRRSKERAVVTAYEILNTAVARLTTVKGLRISVQPHHGAEKSAYLAAHNALVEKAYVLVGTAYEDVKLAEEAQTAFRREHPIYP